MAVDNNGKTIAERKCSSKSKLISEFLRWFFVRLCFFIYALRT